MNIAVYDKYKERELLCSLIAKYSKNKKINLNIDEYSSGDELLEKYEIGKYEMIFLNVESADCEGIAAADKIRKIPDYNVIIILVSKCTDCMECGFDVNAAQFLLKPLEYEVFEEKMNRLFKYIIGQDKIVVFENGGIKYMVNMSEVYLIESETLKGSNRNIKVKLKDEELHVKGVLKHFLLKYNQNLIAINRYTLINIRHIYKLEKNIIELKNGTKLMVSRRRISEIKELIDRSISQNDRSIQIP